MKKSFDFSAAAVATLARADAARALAEDVGAGDLTAGLIASDRQARAQVVARESAVVCGSAWVEATVRQLDPTAQLVWHVKDGERCEANQLVFEVRGLARALLSAERTALNFLQLLSAVASKTAIYVDIVKGTRAVIVDTRKTLPGLRLAQKYAVVTGGGTNHRVGLYDAVLIRRTTSPQPAAFARCWRAQPKSRRRPILCRSKSRTWVNSTKRWTLARRWCCWTT
jgi:nicotinate-nucleotide pyrophosphorylase (carboxylating)